MAIEPQDPQQIEIDNQVFARQVLDSLDRELLYSTAIFWTALQEVEVTWVKGIIDTPPAIVVTPADYLVHHLDVTDINRVLWVP